MGVSLGQLVTPHSLLGELQATERQFHNIWTSPEEGLHTHTRVLHIGTHACVHTLSATQNPQLEVDKMAARTFLLIVKRSFSMRARSLYCSL